MTKPKWVRLSGQPNMVLESEDFCISYLTGEYLNNSDDGQDETAIVIKEQGNPVHFYILNGDWRKEYEELAPKGLHACLEFFREKSIKHKSSWSEDL